MSYPHNLHFEPSLRPSERGSAILAVLIFASIMSLMAVHFIRDASSEANLSTRSLYRSVALNLAEGAIDIAMLDVNNSSIGLGSGWVKATDDAASWMKSYDGSGDPKYNFGQAVGSYFLRIDNWTPATTGTVAITAVGRVSIPGQPPIYRQLRTTVGRRGAQPAILCKGEITFGGSVTVDGYDSTIGPFNASTNRTDSVQIATTSAVVDTFSGGNAEIYGFVATGGAPPSMGPNGRIYGPSTPAGVKVDPSRVRTDFSQNIPAITVPTGSPISIGSMMGNMTLPRAGDLPGPDGRFLYSASSLKITGSRTVVIAGPVDLIVDGEMSMKGSSKIVMNSLGNESLRLYGHGDLAIGGGGITNTSNDPSRLSVYKIGVGSVTLSGTATFSGTIRAPDSPVICNGNATFNGSIVAASLRFNGNVSFHYDTNLSNEENSYYSVTGWVELVSSSTGGAPLKHDRRPPFAFLN